MRWSHLNTQKDFSLTIKEFCESNGRVFGLWQPFKMLNAQRCLVNEQLKMLVTNPFLLSTLKDKLAIIIIVFQHTNFVSLASTRYVPLRLKSEPNFENHHFLSGGLHTIFHQNKSM